MFRHIVAVLGFFAALWSLVIWLTGGFGLEAGALTIESHDPLRPLALALLFVPARALWPTPEQRRAACLLAAVTVTVWLLYCVYTPFDAWWYLRFLLPAWPAMCLGLGALYEKGSGSSSPFRRVTATIVLIAIGLYGVNFAANRAALESGEGDRRYASIAKVVEQFTEPSSVIVAGQNAGAIRYYAGRATLRFDLLDEGWLDRASQWLAERDRPSYYLLEEWEVPLFQRRFGARNTLGALAMAPVFAYQPPGVRGSVFLSIPRDRKARPCARCHRQPAARNAQSRRLC